MDVEYSPPQAGDTAESYAREWDNEECLTILFEAMGKARQVGEARISRTF